MLLASRIWVSVIGLLSILSAYHHWASVEALGDERGVQAINLIGRANIRADMGGIFLAIGILALLASYLRNSALLLATTIIPACALLGRVVSLFLDGYAAITLQPIIIESLVIAALAFAYHIWTHIPAVPS